MEKFDNVIIGGGASGSVCAIMLAQNGLNVAVIDNEKFPAKKLLVTGNGKCNITNKNLNSSFYNQNIDYFLKKFGYEQTVNFFKSIGVYTYFDRENRCYPITNSAKSVVSAIQNQFVKYGIRFLSETSFTDITSKPNGYIIITSKGKIFAQNVVFACGGKLPQILNQSLNISYEPSRPSLCALKVKENTKNLAGERVGNVVVSANVNNQTQLQSGEILFKEQGLSGICIFNLSLLFARSNSYLGEINIDLLPQYDKKDIINLIYNNIQIYENTNKILTGIVSENLSQEILKRLNLNTVELSKNLSDKNIEDIAICIKCLTYTVCDYYDNNQILCGGVKLQSLSKNLESKIHSKIYFAGEMCNVDGECGGYNLQWAFTSAFVVANAIIKLNKRVSI